MKIPSDVAFTPAVKAAQTRLGSRQNYARMEGAGGWETTITNELSAFIAEQNSFFLATATANGQPYIQHRGGPKGFLRVLDEHTLGFADFRGNKQYISLGNLSENPKAHIFLIDYAQRQRIKIWGEAKMVEDDPVLAAKLHSPEYPAKVERVVLFRVTAWDANCPQHIPQLIPASDVAEALRKRDERIAQLEAQVKQLRSEKHQ